MVSKTGCEEHGDEEPFAIGLEDRNEEQSCKRFGRQERRSNLRLVWKTGCDGVGKREQMNSRGQMKSCDEEYSNQRMSDMLQTRDSKSVIFRPSGKKSIVKY